MYIYIKTESMEQDENIFFTGSNKDVACILENKKATTILTNEAIIKWRHLCVKTQMLEV